MKSKKGIISKLIFGGAIVVAVLCIIQLAIYIPAQISMLKDALEGGTDKAQISRYYAQTLIPEIFAYVINGLGIAGILFACGVIYNKKADAEISEISEEALIGEAISEINEEAEEVAAVEEEDESSEPEETVESDGEAKEE